MDCSICTQPTKEFLDSDPTESESDAESDGTEQSLLYTIDDSQGQITNVWIENLTLQFGDK